MKIFLDAGHGGRDPGAIGCGYHEAVLVTELANLLKNELEQRGIQIYLSRSTNQVTLALGDRCRKANATDADLFISLHINSAKNVATGVEVLYYDNVTLAAKLSTIIADVLKLRNRGAKQRKDLYVLNSTRMSAILIEYCFINNLADIQSLLTNKINVTKAIADTIINHYELLPVVDEF
ncbi:N-acetylmuramoyl-L-alanine amidase [Candidatus Epulonipiscium viviparus]|uniref:N-acetylmuramoyl-L-alanine amidase n=1 Tax=Candidatus Epulonipiscium viviparus TaxID=420336 RepID=UPI00016C0EC1|nr:N-acetylmuramoyl-L-alanine amidase [Candidatus Epulopiscium viviparus]